MSNKKCQIKRQINLRAKNSVRKKLIKKPIDILRNYFAYKRFFVDIIQVAMLIK